MKTRSIYKFDSMSCFHNLGRFMAGAMLCLTVFLLGLGISTACDKATIISIDVPGAALTQPQGLNAAGAITGVYMDADGAGFHGFLRTPNGRFTTFDAPGAFIYTWAQAINQEGAIVGWYLDENIVTHGFLRHPNGSFTIIDPPGAGTDPGLWLGSSAYAINAAGMISGMFWDQNNVPHVFLRDHKGHFTTIDVPGADPVPGRGTQITNMTSLNAAGEITGWYVDTNGDLHGFVRTPWGVITKFDVPGGLNTQPQSINPEGEIVGYHNDAGGGSHVFLRNKHGKITIFDFPGAQNTVTYTNNPEGAITGPYDYYDDYWHHCYVRDADGKLTTFDVPFAGKGPFQGAQPYVINAAGAIVGYYKDENYVHHGWLRTVKHE